MARLRSPRRNLEADVARLHGKDFEQALMKSDRINFAVTPGEKSEIQTAARKYGLTVTDYFLRLHRLARAVSASRRGG